MLLIENISADNWEFTLNAAYLCNFCTQHAMGFNLMTK